MQPSLLRVFSFFLAAGAAAAANPPAPEAPEALPPGAQVVSLEAAPKVVELRKSTEYVQLLVTARLADGGALDVTRLASAQGAELPPMLQLSPTGVVRAKADGAGDLVLRFAGKELRIPAKVSGYSAPFTVDYVRDCMPVISKMGCNAGTCHGSKEGKAGFKLSLRGYDPIFDLRAFTDDAKGRRTNVASPDDSLMLLKGTGAVPHEGQQLMTPESDYYKILRAWIAAGAKLDLATQKVTKIELAPEMPVMQQIGSRQQFRIVATYADGLQRDVTAEAFIESGNMEVLAANKTGLMTAVRRGEAPILARFEGNYATTVVTVMGDRAGFVWTEPPANNEIDRFVIAKLRRMKTDASPLCSDEEFVRRVHLDLTGLPPTPEETRAFLADKRDSRWKREALIDRLVGSDEWVEQWSNKWADLLQVNSKFLGGEGAKLFRDWIREEVKANTPYDQFVRKIVTAGGSNKENPPAAYFKILREPAEIMENTTHLFLATRFNCNKCHDHPFERWTQDQYYEMTAWFARTGLERDPASGDRNIGGTAVEGAKPLYEKVVDKSDGEVKHERTGAVTAPSFPYAASPVSVPAASRREQLAAWITSPDNQYFAKSFVNRIWGYLTGTGLIEPLDDIRAGNPPSNPELLDWLTRQFVESKFNVRHLMRLICQSRTYQLSIATTKWNADDQINYSHAKARRLPAETLYDAIYRVTGSTTKIPGVAPGTRAAALADSQTNLSDGFLTNLGRPVRESACECERSADLQMGPIMALVSGPTVGDAISQAGNALAKMAAEIKDDAALVNEMFVRFLGRPANDAEQKAAVETMQEMEKQHAELTAALQQYEAEATPRLQEKERQRQAGIAAAKADLEKFQAEIAPKVAAAEAERQARMTEAQKNLAAFDAAAAPKLAEWEKQQTGQTGWTVLDAAELSSSLPKMNLQKEKDLAIFAAGPDGKQDFTVVAETDLPAVTGVRLEALADSRIPGNGPGRSGMGNFVVSELEAFWSPHQGADWKPLKEWNFNTDGQTEDWKAATVCEAAASGGSLRVKIAPNSRKSAIAGAVTAPPGPCIAEFRIKSAARLNQRLYWTTQKDFSPAEPRSVPVQLARGTGDFVTVRFAFTADSDLTGLRLQTDNANVEFQIDSIRLFAGKPVEPQKIAFKDAFATFSQGGYDAKGAINGKAGGEPDGWAIFPDGIGRNQTAVFVPKDPVALPPGGGVLKVVLRQQYTDGKHYLGKFRLSVTNAPGTLNFGLPRDITEILAVPAAQRTADQQKALLAHFKALDPESKKLQTALAEAAKPLPEDPGLAERRKALQRAELPLPPDPRLENLKRDVALSREQLANRRIIATQDLAWALINSPAFLFNH